MNYHPEISELIWQNLAKHDRSLSWLASRLQVTPSTVSRWLNNETRPGSPDMIVRIADILQIDKSLLLIAAGYGYVEPMDQDSVAILESSTSDTPKFKNQTELQEYIEELPQLFGEKLFEYSRQRGYSQLELAEYLNVSPAAVSNWRSGKRIPNGKTLSKIIGALGFINQDEMNLFLQVWVQSRLANDLSEYLVEAQNDPTRIETLEVLLQNL